MESLDRWQTFRQGQFFLVRLGLVGDIVALTPPIAPAFACLGSFPALGLRDSQTSFELAPKPGISHHQTLVHTPVNKFGVQHFLDSREPRSVKRCPALAAMSVSGEPFNGQPRLGLESFGDQATVNPQVLSHLLDRSCDTICGHQQVRQTDCTELELKRVRQAADCATTPAPAPLSSAPGPPRTSTGYPLPRMAESQVASQSPMILVFFGTMCATET